jgi:hypothetical protein
LRQGLSRASGSGYLTAVGQTCRCAIWLACERGIAPMQRFLRFLTRLRGRWLRSRRMGQPERTTSPEVGERVQFLVLVLVLVLVWLEFVL